MNKKTLRYAVLALALLAALSPVSAWAQTMRGDTDMDGEVNITDVVTIINHLLTGSVGTVEDSDRDTVTVNGVPFVMVRVHGGTYQRIPHTIKSVDHDYWIAQTEVTYELWCAVTGNVYPIDPFPDNPKWGVTWNEWQDFIDTLNILTGRQFRVPTQIEWEFAAYGGLLTRGYTYSGSDDISEVAWYKGNMDEAWVESRGYYWLSVTGKAPNELGLYGMTGGVWEWCQEGTSTSHYVRGGCYKNEAQSCLPSHTYLQADAPDIWRSGPVGLRLAM